MLQLLQPIWLYALTALSAPVIIHLWNQRPGKTLPVGSIALVRENAVSQKKNIRLAEILLLLLRCLLLACIALALAKPVWKQVTNHASKGWVLMNRQQVAATYQHFKPMVDSLLSAGLEFHYFEEGFAKEQLDKAIKATPGTVGIRAPAYRYTINALNEVVPATLPLYLFTDNYLRHFTGQRRAVSLNLHWFTYTPDTINLIPAADTNSLQITIMSGTHTNDARYLKAALDAIQQFSKKNMIIKLVTNASGIPATQDWLFWLADEAIPVNTTAGNILLYAAGKGLPCHSFILPADAASFNPVDLYSSVPEKDSSKIFSAVCWKDGFGRPLLATERKSNILYYWLYTHFDPAWNELPWSDNFPQILYTLLYNGHQQPALADASDKTIIDSTQLMPVMTSEKEAGAKPVLFTSTPLHSVFWLLALILFFAERNLSFYYRKATTHE